MITTILWGLTFQKRLSPPPKILSLITNIINPIFFWTNPPGGVYTSFEGPQAVENALSDAVNAKECSDIWNLVYLGINNILLITFTIIYAIGLIVCAV